MTVSIPRLVVATHNAGKLREFSDLLKPYVREIVSAGDLGLEEPEETGSTFEENALLKAKAAAEATQSLALADDSGLCIHALGGQPGVYSARWGGPEKDMSVAIRRVQTELEGATDRSAHFMGVLALYWPDGRHRILTGRIDGTIIKETRGTGGMGYDPIFIPHGHTKTFAEMSREEKNKMSHRGQATQKLAEFFRQHTPSTKENA